VSIRLRLALYYGALFAVILLLVLLLGYAIHGIQGRVEDVLSLYVTIFPDPLDQGSAGEIPAR